MNDPHTQLDAVGIAWRLGATLFFVLLNGFFVATEFALGEGSCDAHRQPGEGR